jgi:hypothetical protein
MFQLLLLYTIAGFAADHDRQRRCLLLLLECRDRPWAPYNKNA